MALFQTTTLNMVGGTGYVVALPSPVGSLTIAARAECYVRIVGDGTAPATPTVAAVPGAGATTAYLHLLTGESVTAEIDASINTSYEYTRYLAVWAVGSGNLTVLSMVHA